MLVGAQKLKQYLFDSNIRSAVFARSIGKFPSTICRITSGKNRPDIATAALIEEYTNGAVKTADWLVDARQKQDKSGGKVGRK